MKSVFTLLFLFVLSTADSQVLKLRTLDSVWTNNCFDEPTARPLYYEPSSGVLTLIKNGWAGPKQTPTPANSFGNLYIQRSTDWGLTWSANILAYDSKADNNLFSYGSYPTIKVINKGTAQNPKLVTCYSFPTSTNDYVNHIGTMLGIHADDGSSFHFLTKTFNIDGIDYLFQPTIQELTSTSKQVPVPFMDAELIGDTVSFNLATGVGTDDLSSLELNNIAFLNFKNKILKSAIIPNQMKDSVFSPSTVQYGTKRTIYQFFKAQDGTFFIAMVGYLKKTNGNPGPTICFTKSTDNGITWSDIVQVPNSIYYAPISQYTKAGYATDTKLRFKFEFYAKDKDNFSFFGIQRMNNKTLYAKQDINSVMAVPFEVYYSNGNWGSRSIMPPFPAATPCYLPITDVTKAELNHMMYETQIATTVDHNYMVFKVLKVNNPGMMDHNDPTNFYYGYTFTTFSVQFAYRKMEDSVWSYTQHDLNNGDETQSHTWIPNLLPNDLKNIPMISLSNILDSTSVYLAQRNALRITNFNLLDILDVPAESNPILPDLTISSISPNPAKSIIDVKLNLPNELINSSPIQYQIVDMNGNIITSRNVLNTELHLDVSYLMNGNYFLIINTKNEVRAMQFVVGR